MTSVCAMTPACAMTRTITVYPADLLSRRSSGDAMYGLVWVGFFLHLFAAVKRTKTLQYSYHTIVRTPNVPSRNEEVGVAALVIFCHTTTVFPLTSCTMYRRYMTCSYYKYSLNTVKNCLGRSLVLDYECHACWVGVVSRNSDTYVPNIKPVSCQTKKTACWCLVWE